MRTKEDVQARVAAYMRHEGLSETEMVRRTGIPQATLNRMLSYNPSYKGSPHSWRRLAAYAPLQLPDWAAVRALGIDWPALAATRHPEPLRPILAELIAVVVPERQGHNRWGVRVTWTPLGEALEKVRGRNG